MSSSGHAKSPAAFVHGSGSYDAPSYSGAILVILTGPCSLASLWSHLGGGHGRKTRTSGDSRQSGPPAPLNSPAPSACAVTAPNSTRPQMAVTRNVFTVVIGMPP